MIDPHDYKHACRCVDCKHMDIIDDKFVTTGEPLWAFKCTCTDASHGSRWRWRRTKFFIYKNDTSKYTVREDTTDCEYYESLYTTTPFQLF